jgi:acetyl-CoA synthetase
VVPPLTRYKVVSPKQYMEVYGESTRDVESFWARQAENLVWDRRWEKVVDGRPPNVRWFVGGVLRPYYNIVGRHRVDGLWGKTAIIWETEDYIVHVYTFEDLDRLVERMACVLRRLGLRRGGWLLVYAPPTPLSVAAMLAAARLGAGFEPVFTGFGYAALARRIAGAQPDVIAVSDGFTRRQRPVRTKTVLDRALKLLELQQSS